MIKEDFPNVQSHFPDAKLTGDNAIVIGAAGYLRRLSGKTPETDLAASGGLRLE